MGLVGSDGAKFSVPDDVEIPYIDGDGIGPDIMKAALRVFDACIKNVYDARRSVSWVRLEAGEEALSKTGSYVPDVTIDEIRRHRVAIKGPLTTPVGKGIRSINVMLRKKFDLYANIRPVRYLPGLPSPLKDPNGIDITIFRENTEDVYAGIEFASGSEAAKSLIDFMDEKLGVKIADGAGIGIKVMTEAASKRIMRSALDYALSHGKDRVTIMHKGNIMKFTEGAFMQWCYEVARETLGQRLITEQEVTEFHGGSVPSGRVLVNDRIADNMFQQVITRPRDYSVVVTPNLNGDYLSDAVAAEIGGLGVAPGANVGNEYAIFEAVHGSAPKYANKNIANPTSLILAGAMLFEHLGWTEAHGAIYGAIEKTVRAGIITQDLARELGSASVGTAEFADAVIRNLQ